MIENILKNFPDAIINGNGYKTTCPGHADEARSLSIRTGEAGNIILLCSVGCQQTEILKAGGLSVTDLCPQYMLDSLDSEISATTSDGCGDSANDLPDGYFAMNGAIYYRGEKSTYFVCSDFTVSANTCDVDNESWGRRIEFHDDRNCKHDLVIPMSLLSGDGSELRARLMDCGLGIATGRDGRQKFLQLISSIRPTKHIRCVNQTGWHDGAFVLPDAVISASDSPEMMLQNVDRAGNKFKTKGELSDWQEQIGKYCENNSRLMFAVCLSFAASLLPIAEESSGGFHLYGTSSTGKTTALFVAGSVWGGDPRKGFLETWRATTNGLEAVAELHNHSLLLLDEISQVNPHEVGETVYGLSNGFGKSRMSRNLTARRKAEWTLMFLSSGEKTLEQIGRGIGQSIQGGQEARFVNIEADAGKGFGLFDDIGTFDKASDLAKHLSSASRKFYGTPIRKFLNSVCRDIPLVEKRVKECRQMFQARQSLNGASGEIYRVASRFAVVAAAGVLASEFGVVNWSRKDILACSERMFTEWVDTRGSSGAYDIEQGVKQVLSFIDRHGVSRFQDIDKRTGFEDKDTKEWVSTETIVRDRAGFRRFVGGVTEYLILPEVFDQEICRGISPTTIAKELKRRGVLIPGSEAKSLQNRISIPGLGGRKRVYVIVPEVLNEEKAEENQVLNNF